MLLNKEQRAKRGDEQGRSWEGRELTTLGTWGGRRGGVPVEDEQGSGDKSGKSRGRTWRSRTGGRRSRTSGGRLGDEQGKRLEEQGTRR